jgi:hypothetical protein
MKLSRKTKAAVAASADKAIRALGYEPEAVRPKTRADCLAGGMNEMRPCPFVACKHHLYLDVDANTGAMHINFPNKESWELEESCSLDIADSGDVSLERVGELIGKTRERARQIEGGALDKIRHKLTVLNNESEQEYLSVEA